MQISLPSNWKAGTTVFGKVSPETGNYDLKLDVVGFLHLDENQKLPDYAGYQPVDEINGSPMELAGVETWQNGTMEVLWVESAFVESGRRSIEIIIRQSDTALQLCAFLFTNPDSQENHDLLKQIVNSICFDNVGSL